MTSTLRQIAEDITAFIHDADPSEDRFNCLAVELFAFQFAHNVPYRRWCEAVGATPTTVDAWQEIPAVPAAAFKELELTVHPPAERVVVFHSSGTTEQRPSRHFHSRESLAVYEASVLRWFEPHCLADKAHGAKLVFLTPSSEAAPHSSLVHMFETIRRAYPASEGEFLGEVRADGTWRLRLDELFAAFDNRKPLALLGTAFNFVHLLDELAAARRTLSLPPASWVLETGGYKGRSRAMPKENLHAALSHALGIPRDRILTEYGMSELSSQAYDSSLLTPHSARLFRFSPWTRFRLISPETGRESPDGEACLLRVFDLANVASVLAIQAEDLAIRRGDGFELLGRAPAAEARGCSLMTAG